jgi:poly-gamma-glutamate capsule biosynthesis protein CapA/YwtB (metallophosphatase superfamily)
VLSLHVSAPPLYTPPPEVLRAAVDDAVAAGVSVVVAHGTHTVAPIEQRGGTVIAWGLGNAVFSCRCSRETEGLLLRVTVTGEGEVRAGFVPLEAGMDGAAATVLGPEGASFELMRALGVRFRREGATGWL